MKPSPDPSRLPERIEGQNGLVVRLWQTADAEVLAVAVTECHEHLHPWMAWATPDPMPIAERRTQIRGWRRDWEENGDAVYGVFVEGHIAGGCGLHRRVAEDGLEIGYWTHVRFVRQGVATCVAALLTDAALKLPGITHVEIHHDKANRASGGVPRKLGFQFIGEERKKPAAPADVGIDCQWRINRQDWKKRGGRLNGPPLNSAAVS